ncbi:MAG: sugar transporter substrate-binding protein [Bacilli bacterium]|nr:sugar transporter substrate-binding protein [Bacilli bacterium]
MLLIIIILFIAVTMSSCNKSEQLTEPIVEIRIMYPLTDSESFVNLLPGTLVQTYQEIFSNFHKLNPLIKVSFDYNYNYLSKGSFKNLLESNASPDIVYISPPTAFNVKGLLLDLLPLQQSSGAEEIDINQKILDSVMSDGNLLILPFSAMPNAVLYDKALFDAANIPYPQNDWTWEKFREISNKLKLNSSPLFYQPSSLDYLMAGTEKGMLSPNGETTVGYLDSPEAVRTIQWLNGYHRDLNVLTVVPGRTCIGLCISYFGEEDSSTHAINKDTFGVAPMPHFEDGKRNSTILFSGFGISSKSKHPEAAWKFIQYLTLAKNEDSVKFGKHFLTTSKSIAEATGQNTDPIKSIYMDELNYAVKSSFEINPLFNLAWMENNFILSNGLFTDLLTTEDKDIPAKLHKLALAVDQEMKRLKQAEDQQTESTSP